MLTSAKQLHPTSYYMSKTRTGATKSGRISSAPLTHQFHGHADLEDLGIPPEDLPGRVDLDERQRTVLVNLVLL